MSTEPIRVFPVQWPEGYSRTPENKRIWSRFKQTPDSVQRELRYQIEMIGGSQPVISTNAPVKKDGSLYYDAMKRKVAQDPSVAVYFKYKNNQTVLCCDQYETIWENMYAIARTIENMRAIERWGVSDFIKRSFTGFQELPPSTEKTEPANKWWRILGFDMQPPKTSSLSYDFARKGYHLRSKIYHPDGSDPDNEKMQELNNAWEQAQKYFSK